MFTLKVRSPFNLVLVARLRPPTRFFASFTSTIMTPAARAPRRGTRRLRRPRAPKPVIPNQKGRRNRWYVQLGKTRRQFYKIWFRRGQRDVKPFMTQRRRLRIYRNWVEKDTGFIRPARYRHIKSLVGMPRYVNHRQLFHNQIFETQTFRKLFRLTHRQLVKSFRKATAHSKRLFDLTFIKYFEFRLATVAYRANFAASYLQARQQAKLGYFKVNGLTLTRPNYMVNIGDCVLPHEGLLQTEAFTLMRMFCTPIQPDQYPSYMLLNERVPAALIFNNPNPAEVKHTLPVSWQFMTLTMLPYN